MTFSMTFSPNTRGLFSLPCVEVVSRMGDVREGVRVVIAQQKPHESLRNCTVYIRDKGETTTSGELVHSSLLLRRVNFEAFEIAFQRKLIILHHLI